MQKCPACPKCNSYYSTKDAHKFNRNPLLLVCGHTFCSTCLHKDTCENRVICPTCQRLTPLDGSIKSLYPDVYTTGLIVCNQKILLDQELSKLTPAGMSVAPVKPREDRREKLCRECCKRQAVCKCDRCDFIMCKLCFNQVHSISNTLKQHQAIQLTEEESSFIHLETASKCLTHEGKLIEYFCEDDNTPVCSRCVITGEHRNHSIVSMEEKNKTVIADMEPALQTANSVIKKMKQAEKSLVSLLPDMRTETADVLNEINIYFTQLHSVLQAREKQLTMEVYQAFKSGLEPLQGLKQQMQDDIRQLEIAVKAGHRFLGSTDEVVLNAKEILENLQQAKEVPCIIEPKQKDATDKIRFHRDDELLNMIWRHGTVSGTVPAKADWFTLSQKPEYLITDDGESLESRTSIDSLSAVSSSRLSDVIVESESIVDNMSSRGSNRSATPDLDTVPTRERIKGSATQVYVTHIRHPCRFAVQKLSDTYKLDQLSKAINSYANSRSSMKPRKLERGDLILAKFKDHRWYRARVRDVTPGETEESTIIEVIYIDYGNSEKITQDRTRVIQPKHSRQPEFLIECCLHDIRPPNETGTWPQEAVDAFVKMTDAKKMNLIVVREVNNILHVDLCKPPNEDIKDDRPMSVRDTLVFLELAQFISPDAGNVVGQSTIRRAFLSPEPRAIGSSFTGLVTSATDPLSFCVQEMSEDSKYFAEVMNEMQNRYNSEIEDLWAIECPQIGMPCVCKYSDGLWYRATVIGLPGDKQVDVLYIDFGNSERLPYWSLRKILDRFITIPVQGIRCRLIDVAPTDMTWTQEAVDWWTKRVTMQLFHVHVSDISKEEISVILLEDFNKNTLNGEIVNAGYAVSTGNGSTAIPPQYLQPEIDSSDESVSVRSESTSYNSSDIFTTPVSSPSRPNTQLEVDSQSDTQNVGLEPKQQKGGKSQRKQTTPGKMKKSPKKERLIAQVVDSSSPQKEKTDSPEKTKLSQGVDTRKTALKLDVDVAKRPVQSTQLSEPGSPSIELEVVMCNFTSPSDFYLQVATAGRDGLDRLMEDIGNEYRMSEDQWITWEAGSFCAARHPVDKRWYRAKILQIIHKSIIEVFMVDYGYTEQISISEIRPLLKAFLADMCFAFRCHLDDIVSAGDMKKWSKTACEFMENEVKDKKMYIQKKGNTVNDSCPVDLLMEEEIAETALEPSRKHYYSLTDKLIDQGLAIPTKRRKKRVVSEDDGVRQRKVFPVFQWRPPVLPVESSILVTPVYVDYDGVVWVQEVKENDTTMNKMIARIQNKFADSEPHRLNEIKWKEGQACVALFHLEGVWHRAKVLRVETHRIQVEFVDFGNVEWVTHDHMRADVMEFVDIPIQCFPCVFFNVLPISESGKWPVDALDKIHHQIVNNPCVIDIIVCEADQPLQVTMTLPDHRDVSEWLYREGQCYRKDDISYLVDKSKLISQVLSRRNLTYPLVSLPPVNECVAVCITHVETPDVVYFQFVRQVECLDDRSRQINEQLDRLSYLAQELMMVAPTCMLLPKPRPGLPCLGQYSVDNCWYRGLVIEANEGIKQATVLYVDYGNFEEVTFDRIRALPVQYLDLPAQGVRMKLNGVRMSSGQKYWTTPVLKSMMETIGNQVKIACLKTHSPVTGALFSQEQPSCLAYQTLIDQRFIDYTDQVFDETLVREIQDDFIVESQEDSNDDLDNSSSTTTKGDNSMSLEGPGKRTHIKSWSDQGGEDDSLD